MTMPAAIPGMRSGGGGELSVMLAPARVVAATSQPAPEPATTSAATERVVPPALATSAVDVAAAALAVPPTPAPVPAATAGASDGPAPPSDAAQQLEGSPQQPEWLPSSLSVEGRVADSALLTAELQQRALEFPAELAYPVRLHDRLVADYPAVALAAGEQGVVVLWAVLDPNGVIEELQPVAGPERLVAAAMDAVRAGRFMPAARNGEGIRYPIALQFDFRLPEGMRSAAATPSVATVHDGATEDGAP